VAQHIRRFGVGQTAKVFGVLYGLMGLVFVPFFLVAAAVAPHNSAFMGFGLGFVILIPILYAVFGFIFIAIACLLYNMVAGWIGGIEMEITA